MNNQTSPSNYPQFYNPPPPPVFDDLGVRQPSVEPPEQLRCIICNGSQSVAIQSLKKDYIPFVAYFALLFGALIGLLLIFVLRVQHNLNLPFCKNCWKRSRNANRFETMSVLVFFLSIIAGVVVLLQFDSVPAFFVFPTLAVGLVVWGQIHKKKNSPKIKKINRKQVIVSSASGEVSFAK